MDSFVSKLKQLAVTCDFGDHKDDFIRDQVIDKCTSTALRRRLLRDKDLTLFMLQDIARTMEAVDQQAAKMEKLTIKAVGKLTLHASTQSAGGKPQLRHKPSASSQQSIKYARQLTCNCCSRVGHYGKMCTVAKGKQCRSCGKEGHFAAVCHTKTGLKVNQVTNEVPHNKVSVDITGDDDDPDWVFVLQGDTDDTEMSILVDGMPVAMLIDSGASCNIVGSNVFQTLRNNGHTQLKTTFKQLYAYGSDTPLAVEGFFTAGIRPVTGNKSVKADVLVVNGAQTSLLGRKTAIALGILHIGAMSNFNAVHYEDTSALTTSLQ